MLRRALRGQAGAMSERTPSAQMLCDELEKTGLCISSLFLRRLREISQGNFLETALKRKTVVRVESRAIDLVYWQACTGIRGSGY